MNMLTNTTPTMTSRDIAKITGKEHKHVYRDIENMLNQLEMSGKEILGYVQLWTHPQNKQEYREFCLPRRLVECLLLGYSAKARMRVLERLDELQNELKPQLPQTFAEALQLAADQAKLIEEKTKELEIAKPKVEFVDRFCISEGNKTFRQVAKILKANEREFREFLVKNKIMYKLGGKWMAYQNHLDAKRFYVSTGVADNDRAFTDCKFTPKGVEYVAGKWMAREL